MVKGIQLVYAVEMRCLGVVLVKCGQAIVVQITALVNVAKKLRGSSVGRAKCREFDSLPRNNSFFRNHLPISIKQTQWQ